MVSRGNLTGQYGNRTDVIIGTEQRLIWERKRGQYGHGTEVNMVTEQRSIWELNKGQYENCLNRGQYGD